MVIGVAVSAATGACIESVRRRWLCFAAISAAGCASVNPVLAPSRVLPAEAVVVDVGGGYAAPVMAQELEGAVAAEARLAGGSDSVADREALVRGALAYGNTPVGVASYFAARAGLGSRAEGHIALLGGRLVRVGARRVFWIDRTESWSLSLGTQGRLAFQAGLLDGSVPGLSVLEGWLYGGDCTAVLGRTSSELYDLWFGLRAGYTHGNARMSLSRIRGGVPFESVLHRLEGAAAVGLRVGFGRLAAMAEIGAVFGYYWARSDQGIDGSGAMLSLVPAAALSYGF